MKSKKSTNRHPSPPKISRRKLWLFRVLAMVVIPLTLLGGSEAGLRLFGAGYPTAFLLSSSNRGVPTFVQNAQFGWRFFGRSMARQPAAISITKTKPPGTIRIFVFGESAAFGDPQPRFGLPRMLQAMLELRHPGVKFEIINAAMTGINSHTVLPIARDCAQAGGDIWVVYMGNNEVVGPFGAGTVFGAQAPPLALARAILFFKTSRVWQIFESLGNRLRPPPPSLREWGGMEMFLNQRVRASDPRVKRVHESFRQNLDDILRAGRAGGAKIVLSTVAVNLKDCAPFSSLHRADLTGEKKSEWEEDYRHGLAALNSGQLPEATKAFNAAAGIDDTYAELRWCLGQCLLEDGRKDEARKEFLAARDLDALRFRCDSELNQVIRQAGVEFANDGVRFADAEKDFADASADGIPGAEFFYEHVHLTFAGNYRLARVILEQVEPLLPAGIKSKDAPWPDLADCANRLARTDRETQLGLIEVLGRLADPPYLWQLNHAEHVARLKREAQGFPPAADPASLHHSLAVCQSAIAAHPDDPLLYQQLAELEEALGDYPATALAARQSLDLLPSNSEAWQQFGMALARQQNYQAAADAFRHSFAIDLDDVWARQNLGLSYEKLGQRDAAIAEFRRALVIKPKFGMAWLSLGQIYESTGQTNLAEGCFQKAIANPIHRVGELTTLAQFCQSRKWFGAASTNYAEAVQLNPIDPDLRVGLGLVLSGLNRHEQAAQSFQEAARLDPNLGQTYFLCGVEYGILRDPARAEVQFRQAARLLPNVMEARINLGISLLRQQKTAEAREVFTQVLQAQPANTTAAQYLQSINSQK